MTLYGYLGTMKAEKWDGDPASVKRLAAFAGDAVRGIVGGSTAAGAPEGPLLLLYCAHTDDIERVPVGGAVAAESDGSGFYAIQPEIFKLFRPATAPEPSTPAADDTLTDDELANALDRLEWDQEG